MKRLPVLGSIMAVIIIGLLVFFAGPGRRYLPFLPRLPDSREEWIEVFIQEDKVAYVHNQLNLVSLNDRTVHEYGQEVVKRRRRFGVEAAERILLTSIMDRGLHPISFNSTQTTPGGKVIIRGRVVGKFLKLTIAMGGESREQDIPLPKGGFIWDPFAEEVFYAGGLHKGRVEEFTVFYPDDLSIGKRRFAVLEEYFNPRADSTGKIFKISSTYTPTGGKSLPAMILLVEPPDRLLKADVPDLGMSMEPSTRELSQDFSHVAELGSMSLIRSNVRFPHPSWVTGLSAQVEIGDGDIGRILIDDERQDYQVLERNNRALLTVKSFSFDPESSPALPITQVSVAPYLEPTRYVESNHPAIHQTAIAIIGREKNAWKASRLIMKWVFAHMRPGLLNTDMLTARQALRQGRGDCSEYAALFAALARAVGIPTKVVAGLVYQQGAFLYHIWNEVYVGTWVAIDPALDQEMVDATHIKLAEGTMDAASLTAMGVDLQRTMNRTSIQVQGYRELGKEVPAGRWNAGVQVSDYSYHSAPFGFRIYREPGWKFDINPPSPMSILLLSRPDRDAALNLIINELPASRGVAGLFGDIEEGLVASVENYRTLSRVIFTRSGIPCLEAVGQGEVEGTPINFVVRVMAHYGNAYYLVSSYPAVYESEIRPQVARMLDGFHFAPITRVSPSRRPPRG